jgi:histone H2A
MTVATTGKGKGGRGDKKSTTSSAKAGLQFPVGRIGRYHSYGSGSTCVPGSGFGIFDG